MKKNHLFGSFLSVVFIFVFFSCDTGAFDSLISYSGLSMSEKKTWDYSESNDTYILDENTSSLTISGNLSGKTLYVADINSSNSYIDKEYVKYIGSSTRNIQEYEFNEDLYFPEENFNHFIGYDFTPDPKNFSSERVAVSPLYSVTPLSYSVGSTSKTVWIANASSNTKARIQTTATLWAYNDVCNVWVVNGDSYLSTHTEKLETAKKIAAAFNSFYPVVREVFGDESDEIYTSYYLGKYYKTAMCDVSDTETKVNIVICDLYGDKENGSVLGVFSNGDYYANKFYQYSNVGKYFYVDSYFVTKEETKEEIFSTLVHEFQHMIHFGVKSMTRGLSSDTNFNEMLSMLCEDMMQQFLTDNGYTITDENSPKGRLVKFMTKYYDCGIREYQDDNLAYANAYAFGSWLCRQYGGALLVKKMMENNYTNNECIVNAVNSLNGTNFSFDDLFVQFIKACYGKDSTYTFNKDAKQTFTYSNGSSTYSYPMKAINLWKNGSIYDLSTTAYNRNQSYKNYLQTSDIGSYLYSSYKFFGPLVFKYNSYHKLFAPYGIFLKCAGSFKYGAKSSTLAFRSSSGYTKDGMKIILYIK